MTNVPMFVLLIQLWSFGVFDFVKTMPRPEQDGAS